MHGHCAHSGGLRNLSRCLVEHNYIVYAFDLRGHGKSSGKRGFIRTWDEYRGDLHAFCKLVISECPECPLFIVGNSLGGVICLDYALYYDADLGGLIAIAPAISYEVKLLEKWLIAIMGRLKPDYRIEVARNPDLLTQDPDMLAQINSDTLRHNKATPGLGRGLIQTVSQLMKAAHAIKVPCLLQFGLNDEITPPTKLREFFECIGSEDKQKIEYNSMWHRPFDDVGRQQFLLDMIGWLDRQLVKT